jgi:hypothetical protein
MKKSSWGEPPSVLHVEQRMAALNYDVSVGDIPFRGVHRGLMLKAIFHLLGFVSALKFTSNKTFIVGQLAQSV